MRYLFRSAVWDQKCFITLCNNVKSSYSVQINIVERGTYFQIRTCRLRAGMTEMLDPGCKVASISENQRLDEAEEKDDTKGKGSEAIRDFVPRLLLARSTWPFLTPTRFHSAPNSITSYFTNTTLLVSHQTTPLPYS